MTAFVVVERRTVVLELTNHVEARDEAEARRKSEDIAESAPLERWREVEQLDESATARRAL